MRAVSVAALLLLLAPAAAQEGEELCVVTISPASDFSSIEVNVDLLLSDADRANASREADADADGNVTSDEVEAWEAASVERVPASRWESLADRRVVLDGHRAPETTIRKDLKGFEGPVDEDRKRGIAEIRLYDFGAGDREAVAHRVVLGGEARVNPRPVIETVVVTAPEGWRVWSLNGTEHLAPSVTVRGLDYRRTFEVTYLKDGTDPSDVRFFGEPLGGPAAGAVAVLAAAGAVAAFARRRATLK